MRDRLSAAGCYRRWTTDFDSPSQTDVAALMKAFVCQLLRVELATDRWQFSTVLNVLDLYKVRWRKLISLCSTGA